MFYKTQIKSISGGSVYDTRGNCLRFIGYLPVKVGDSVYADGKYIFGNVPPKGSPAVFDDPSGIPVSASNFKGYFDKNGRFKKYNVKGDEWLVNDKKRFMHDLGADIITPIFLPKGKNCALPTAFIWIHNPSSTPMFKFLQAMTFMTTLVSGLTMKEPTNKL